MHTESGKFRIRGFATLLLLLSASVVAISGIALYLRPEGSLARWAGWSWLGLDKQHWEAVHTIFVLLALVTALVHLWYNWKPLINYVRSKASLILPSGRRVPLVRELLAASAVASAVLCAAIMQWQPLALLIDLRSDIKDGKYALYAPPPVADADRMSILALCEATGMSEQSVAEKARTHGIAAEDLSLTLGAIAEKHSLSPEGLYQRLK